uniref:Ribosomal protein L29 n=1 Tax=Renouxia sp. TaxID=2485823 RepID=A0A3G3MHC8_9FLOR|nr:ribosomal protein L29 [Renouxia sp.]
MSLLKMDYLRDMSKTEIYNKILEVKKEIFDLKFKQATRQTVKRHLLKHKKHLLAQLLTLESQPS